MKLVITMQDLDCASCASNMEQQILKIKGVQSCNVSFLLQRMTLEIDDDRSEEILKKIRKAVRKVEPDCKLEI